MSTPDSSAEQSIPPSRQILDLDKPMQREALLEALELLRNAPLPLHQEPSLRQWRGQLLARLSYLLMHCSTTPSGSSHVDLAELGRHYNLLAQSLLTQDHRLSQLSAALRC